MARRPSATPRLRPWASARMLALALLLLLAQQWGMLHGVAHGLSGRGLAPATAAAAAQALPAPSAHATEADDAGHADRTTDALCGTCLVLAGLGALVAPVPLLCLAATSPAQAPPLAPAPGRGLRAATPFLARAPPALPVPV